MDTHDSEGTFQKIADWIFQGESPQLNKNKETEGGKIKEESKKENQREQETKQKNRKAEEDHVGFREGKLLEAKEIIA